MLEGLTNTLSFIPFPSRRDADIPQFTICPQYAKGYNQTLLEENYGLSAIDVAKFKYPINLENSQNFFYEVTYDISNLMKSVEIETEGYFPGTKSLSLKLEIQTGGIKGSDGTMYQFEDLFENKTYVSFGQCFTLKISSAIKNQLVNIDW